jgi:radical SAM superfamily enzyme YgiQ (UPF0313 family)
MNEEKPPIRRLAVVLVRPSKYDDDGYVIRYFRGVLPSNTLCCLYGLTETAAQSDRFAGRVEFRIHTYDETVQRVVPERIVHRARREADRILVAIAGIQTNQFPRAADLARRFNAAGCKVMMGGFHISAALAMGDGMPQECRDLLDAGVTLVKGEVDEAWPDMLEDVIEDRIQPIYDIVNRPNIESAPVPKMPAEYIRRFAFPHFGTLDTGRGCPFDCSFCTVINIQGRKMRLRSPELILQRIRENYDKRKGLYFYVLCDDNVARNSHWEELFDGLIRMRKEEGIDLDFFMQVDVPAYKIPNFVKKAAEAGCTQVFIGVETLNPKNIEAADKKQNAKADYLEMVQAWHNGGVHVHAAYIIGFPYDTYDSVMEAVDKLAKEYKFDQASFFMLTPLPGSRDYDEAVAAGAVLGGDLNEYDSFHAVAEHPLMSQEEWLAAYRDAWKRFYTFDNMKEIMLHSSVHSYWGIMQGLIWYRAAMIEGAHPMLTGFFRLKDRKERRPGCAIDPWWVHARKRGREIRVMLRAWLRLFFEMQELWLQTRIPAETLKPRRAWREHLGHYVTGMKRNLRNTQERLHTSVGHLRDAVLHNAESLRSSLPSVKMPEAGRRLQQAGQRWWERLVEKLHALSVRGISTRRHLDRFWRETTLYLRRRTYWRINPFLVVWNFTRDLQLSFSFTLAMLAERVF